MPAGGILRFLHLYDFVPPILGPCVMSGPIRILIRNVNRSKLRVAPNRIIGNARRRRRITIYGGQIIAVIDRFIPYGRDSGRDAQGGQGITLFERPVADRGNGLGHGDARKGCTTVE